MKNQCVLVTGAAGFIGSHLVDRLLAGGNEVIGIDDLSLGLKSNLASAFKNPSFSFHEANINHLSKCIELLQSKQIDCIWHMAANSDIPAGVEDWNVDHEKTFLTTFNSLKLAEKLQIPKFCFASSSAIYGDHQKVLTEDSGPLFPISNYGAMKLASEGVITVALEKFLKNVWIFRFPNVVGNRTTHGVIFDFIRKLEKTPDHLTVLGDGTQEKPYLHVSELIDALTFCHANSEAKANYFNVGVSDSATTVKYIAESVVKSFSPRATIGYSNSKKGWVGDVPKFSYSTEKVNRLGWKPKLSSNDAIDLTIKQIVEQGLPQ